MTDVRSRTEVADAIRIQIGSLTIAAISGGRSAPLFDEDGVVFGLRLPVGSGYSVEVELDYGSDTYVVRRVFTRAGKRFVKGEIDYVYADQVSDVAYAASSFRSYDFGE